jgi:hypothetical protein
MGLGELGRVVGLGAPDVDYDRAHGPNRSKLAGALQELR